MITQGSSNLTILSDIPAPPIAPKTILEIQDAYLKTQILISALHFDLFTLIGHGYTTTSILTSKLNVDERGIRILLNALCACHLLSRTNEQYKLTSESHVYLQRSSPFYIGGAIAISEKMRHVAEHLTEVIRSGKPVRVTNKQSVGEQFFPEIAQNIFKTHYIKAREVVEHIRIGPDCTGFWVLDIGCGAAPWSIAIAERDPGVHVTAVDFPKIIEQVTKPHVNAYGLNAQYEFIGCSLRDSEFKSEQYDMAILGHILHSEGPTHAKKLIKKVVKTIKMGGTLVIAEMLTSEDHTSPWFPVLFAVNMLLNTDEGETFSLSQIEKWLIAAGFDEIKPLTLTLGGSPLIIATRVYK